MPTITKGSSTQTVIVDRKRTVGITHEVPSVVEVEDNRSVTTVTEEASRTLVAGTSGVQGPAGVSNIPNTDSLPEGGINLYYTEDRFASAFDSAMSVVATTGDGVALNYDTELHQLVAVNTDKGSVAISLHESVVDPHPQYLGDTESIDGGNF